MKATQQYFYKNKVSKNITICTPFKHIHTDGSNILVQMIDNSRVKNWLSFSVLALCHKVVDSILDSTQSACPLCVTVGPLLFLTSAKLSVGDMAKKKLNRYMKL